MTGTIDPLHSDGAQQIENSQDKADFQTKQKFSILERLGNSSSIRDEMSQKVEKFQSNGKEFIRQTLAPAISDLKPTLANSLAVSSIAITPLTIPTGILALGLAKALNKSGIFEKMGTDKLNEQHFALAGLLIGSLGTISISLLAQELAKKSTEAKNNVDDEVKQTQDPKTEKITDNKVEKTDKWKEKMELGNKNRQDLLTKINNQRAQVQADYDEIFDFFENEPPIQQVEKKEDQRAEQKQQTPREVPVKSELPDLQFVRPLTDLKVTTRDNLENISLVDLVANKYEAVVQAFKNESNKPGVVNTNVMSEKFEELTTYLSTHSPKTGLPDDNQRFESALRDKKTEANEGEIKSTPSHEEIEQMKEEIWDDLTDEEKKLLGGDENLRGEIKSPPETNDIQQITDEIWDDLTDEERKLLGQ